MRDNKMTASNMVAASASQIQEIIGCDVSVADAPNHSMIGINGTIIYETKSMIIIEDKNGAVKQIPKDGARLDVWNKSNKIRKEKVGVICGNNILKRPFERV